MQAEGAEKLAPLTASERQAKLNLVLAYADFWNNIKFRKGWETPLFTFEEVRPLLEAAAEVVVRIRSILDKNDSSFKMRLVDGDAREYLHTVKRHPLSNPQRFVRNLVHATLRDAAGYVEGLTQEAVDGHLAKMLPHEHVCMLVDDRCSAEEAHAVVLELQRAWSHVSASVGHALCEADLDHSLADPADPRSSMTRARLRDLRKLLASMWALHGAADACAPPLPPPRHHHDDDEAEEAEGDEGHHGHGHKHHGHAHAHAGHRPSALAARHLSAAKRRRVAGELPGRSSRHHILSHGPRHVRFAGEKIVKAPRSAKKAAAGGSTLAAPSEGQEPASPISPSKEKTQAQTQAQASDSDSAAATAAATADAAAAVAADAAAIRNYEDENSTYSEGEGSAGSPVLEEEAPAEDAETLSKRQESHLLEIHQVERDVASIRREVQTMRSSLSADNQLIRSPKVGKWLLQDLQTKCSHFVEQLTKDLISLDSLHLNESERPHRKAQVVSIQQLIESLETIQHQLHDTMNEVKKEEARQAKNKSPIRPTLSTTSVASEPLATPAAAASGAGAGAAAAATTAAPSTAQPTAAADSGSASEAAAEAKEEQELDPEVLRARVEKELVELIHLLKLRPRVEIHEQPTSYVIQAYIPDLDVKELSVSVTRDSALAIKGFRGPAPQMLKGMVGAIVTHEASAEEVLRSCASRFGTFMEVFQLPADVEAVAVSGTYERGVLQIVLPKKAGAAGSAAAEETVAADAAGTGAGAGGRPVPNPMALLHPLEHEIHGMDRPKRTLTMDPQTVARLLRQQMQQQGQQQGGSPPLVAEPDAAARPQVMMMDPRMMAMLRNNQGLGGGRRGGPFYGRGEEEEEEEGEEGEEGMDDGVRDRGQSRGQSRGRGGEDDDLGSGLSDGDGEVVQLDPRALQQLLGHLQPPSGARVSPPQAAAAVHPTGRPGSPPARVMTLTPAELQQLLTGLAPRRAQGASQEDEMEGASAAAAPSGRGRPRGLGALSRPRIVTFDPRLLPRMMGGQRGVPSEESSNAGGASSAAAAAGRGAGEEEGEGGRYVRLSPADLQRMFAHQLQQQQQQQQHGSSRGQAGTAGEAARGSQMDPEMLAHLLQALGSEGPAGQRPHRGSGSVGGGHPLLHDSDVMW